MLRPCLLAALIAALSTSPGASQVRAGSYGDESFTWPEYAESLTHEERASAFGPTSVPVRDVSRPGPRTQEPRSSPAAAWVLLTGIERVGPAGMARLALSTTLIGDVRVTLNVPTWSLFTALVWAGRATVTGKVTLD
jgi:hypothetical protein